MSGIAGIFYRDGRPAQPETIQTMVDAMAHRGSDGIHTWHEGAVALGHCMLHTTPESLYDNLPMESRNGNLVLTADARIDNREELIRTLRLKPYRDAPLTDCDLILAAYQKWGEECPKYLLGAFAFAIWNKRERHLFCARDHFGVKPLYGLKSNDTFVFASEIGPVFAGSNHAKRLNRLQVAGFVSGIPMDPSETFYQGIRQHLPRHSLVVSTDRERECNYWTFGRPETLRLSTKEEYAAAFKEILVDAVNARTRSPRGFGCELSGGLDSSSITCLASINTAVRGSISTYTNVEPDFPECNELQYVQSVLNPTLQPRFIYPESTASYEDRLSDLLVYLYQPFTAPNLDGSLRRYQRAAEEAPVLLSGHGGDQTISHGWGRLKELAGNNDLIRLGIECVGLSRAYENSAATGLFLGYLRKYGKGRTASLAKRMHTIKRRFESVKHRLSAGERSFDSFDLLANRWQDDDSLEAAKATWREKHSANFSTERESHLATVSDYSQAEGFNVLGQVAAVAGVELRYPLWDKRVVEFCVRLPAEQKLRNGYGRFVFRVATKGVLPDEIRWRRDKTDFTNKLKANLREAALGHCSRGIEELFCFVDQTAYQELQTKLLDDAISTSGASCLWRAILLNLWLGKVS